MSKGEKAELTIEPEWAYGKKGNIDAKYPLVKETKNCQEMSGMCCSRIYLYLSLRALTVSLVMRIAIAFVYHAI